VAANSKPPATLALLQDWWAAWQQAQHDPAQEVIVLAARRAEVDRLNTACQELLAAGGRHGPERLQEVTLPRSYLDGRRQGERNRRVDLAYAPTGVPVLPARRLPSMLRTLPAVLGPNGSPAWPTRPGSASTPPPDSQHAWAPERPPLPGCTKAARSALDWFDQRRPGALPSSDDYGSSVEPAAKLHPLWQAFCSGGSEWWRRRSEGSLALGLIAASRSCQTVR
jgi:hypothetical protein